MDIVKKHYHFILLHELDTAFLYDVSRNPMFICASYIGEKSI